MNLTSGLISAKTTGPIGWLIFDNQSKLNALSPGMYEDGLEVIEAYKNDPAIKVVVMRGAKVALDGSPEEVFAEKNWRTLKSTNLGPPFAAQIGHQMIELILVCQLQVDMRVVEQMRELPLCAWQYRLPGTPVLLCDLAVARPGKGLRSYPPLQQRLLTDAVIEAPVGKEAAQQKQPRPLNDATADHQGQSEKTEIQ